MNSLFVLFVIVISVVVRGVAAFSSTVSPFVVSQEAKMNFEKWRQYLAHAETFSPVAGGGWFHVETLADHPKQELVDYIMTNSQNQETLAALVGLLQAQGKGYDSSLVEGEWVSVLSQQGSKSPKIQKLVQRGEEPRNGKADFDTADQKFRGQVQILKWGDLRSTVAYNPVSDNFDTINDKIVLRRIACDIVGASWKFWKLPRIPLPLRAKGGYLDFVYLDNDMRITRGNRGGLFVHFRPEFLERQRDLRRNENVGGKGI